MEILWKLLALLNWLIFRRVIWLRMMNLLLIKAFLLWRVLWGNLLGFLIDCLWFRVELKNCWEAVLIRRLELRICMIFKKSIIVMKRMKRKMERRENSIFWKNRNSLKILMGLLIEILLLLNIRFLIVDCLLLQVYKIKIFLSIDINLGILYYNNINFCLGPID